MSDDYIFQSLKHIKKETMEDLSILHSALFQKGWSAKTFEDLLSQKTALCHLTYHKKSHQIIGCIIMRSVVDEAEILTLMVHQEYQGSGIGKKLCYTCFNSIKSKGIAKIFLEVNQDNEIALKLYEKLGFEVVTQRKGYYRKDKNLNSIDAYLMKLTL